MLSSIRARRKKWRVTPSVVSWLSNEALKSICGVYVSGVPDRILEAWECFRQGVFIE
jgi:hypothetical protein